MIVGTAEVLIVANTAAFKRELEATTAPALRGVSREAEAQGALAGANLRKGVAGESKKLEGDLEKHGRAAGAGLSGGLAGGLGKASLLIAGVGLAGAAAGIKLAEGMQSADASIAAASGTSVAAATRIGDAFLKTGGKTEFSAQEMARAYAAVAGQLKSTEGHALSVADATRVMGAADDLATAKHIDLGTATSALAGIMQAFHLSTADAAGASDTLYNASTATGQSVDSLATSIEKVRSKLGETSPPLGQLAGLLVDMTRQGITGRAALAALNGAMNTLIKPTSAAKDEQKKLALQVFDSNGKFVGLGSVIDQLHPKFAKMTQQQQLAASTALFGAGAARQMLAVINAGPAAYDKATASVNRHGAAQAAAAKQTSSFQGQSKILGAELSDVATRLGAVLIPALTLFVSGVLRATTFVTQHKAVLIALATVVTGVLGTAVTVFAVNKMAKFGESFMTASGHMKAFASDVQTVVGKVVGLFGRQTAAAQDMSKKVSLANAEAGAASEAEATKVASATTAIEGDNLAAGASFGDVPAGAARADTELVAPLATEVSEVQGADSEIEAANATAGASFAGLAARIAGWASIAAAFAQQVQHIATETPAQTVSGPLGGGGMNNEGAPTTSRNPLGALAHGLGINLPSWLGGGAEGAIVSKPTLALIGEAGPEALIPLSRMPGASALPGTVRANAASASGLTGGQVSFAQRLAQMTGLNPNVIGAWLLAEESGGAAASRQAAGNNDWLNIGYTDSGTFGAGGAQWRNPISAANATAGWLHGQDTIPGYGRAAPGVQAILHAAGASPLAQVGAIQHSGWASGGYPELATLLSQVQRGGGVPLRQQAAGTHRQQAAGTALIPAAVATMLATANALVGTRYTWGGGHSGWDPVDTLKKIGVDCSGFVSQVLHAGGVSLPGPQNTEGLASNLQKGGGRYVTVWDRSTGAQNQQHALIDLMGKWFESGGRASPGGVSQISAAQARAELAGGGFHAYHPDLGGVIARPLGLTTTTSGMGYTAQLKALGGGELAKLVGDIHSNNMQTLRADVDRTHDRALHILETDLKRSHDQGLARMGREIAAAHSAALHQLNRDVLAASLQQHATTVAATGAATAQSIADATKIALDTQAQSGKSGLELVAAQAQTQMDRMGAFTGAAIATAQMQLDRTASGTLAQARAQAHLADVQAAAAIATAQAQAALDKASAAAAAAAAEIQARQALTQAADQALLNSASAQATAIHDATKLELDTQAQAGLSGAALAAAQAQTALDQIVQSSDAAIAAAQAQVDSASADSADQAAAALARAQATATISEAQAQAVLDKAAAAAQATQTAGAATPGAAAMAPISIVINGAGMTPGQVFGEVAWALHTGALPVAPAAAAA